MPISLNGNPIIIDLAERELETWIERFINPEDYLPWTRRSWPGFGLAGITYPLGYRHEPVFHLGRMRWPTGASRWAYGHFLLDVNQCNLQSLLNMAFSNGQYKTVPLIMDTSSDMTGEKVAINVYVMPPTPLMPLPTKSGINRLYLITVVDQRFFWYYYNMGNFNVTVEGTQTPVTWDGLYQYIFKILNVQFTQDKISANYLLPSTMFNLPYEPIPPVLDAVAWNVGQRIAVNYNGSVTCQIYADALGALNSDMASHPKRALVAGGQRFTTPL